jgi:hypothetical protein
MSNGYRSDIQEALREALAQTRTRSPWNDRLAHWERPASDHDEAKSRSRPLAGAGAMPRLLLPLQTIL